MSYLMDGAKQQIESEIRDIYDAIHGLYSAGISTENTGYKLLEQRLEKLGEELKGYEE